MNLTKERIFTEVRKILNLTSRVITKLPSKQDTTLSTTVKCFSIVDDIRSTYLDGDEQNYKLRLKEQGYIDIPAEPWASLFENEIILTGCPKEVITLTKQDTSGIKVSLNNKDNIIFVCNYYDHSSIYRNRVYLSNKDIDIYKLLDVTWDKFGSYIYLDLNKNAKTGNALSLSPVEVKSSELSPQLFDKINIFPSICGNCTLLVGDPGVGKTAWVNEIAKLTGKAIKISPSVITKYSYATLISVLEGLKCNLIFIDDLDHAATLDNYSDFFEFLKTVKGMGISVFLSINDPHNVDYALLRSGRIDTILEFFYPLDEEIDWFLSRLGVDLSLYPDVKKDTEGFSHADFASLLQKVKYMDLPSAVREVRSVRNLHVRAKAAYLERNKYPKTLPENTLPIAEAMEG